MGVPTFVNSTSASLTTAGTGPLTCNVPSGVSNGDLLLAHVSVGSGAGVPSTPSGWTALPLSRTTGSSGFSYLFARLASSEPASYDWSVDASSEYNVINHAYRPSSGTWSSIADAVAIVRNQRNASSTTLGVPELPLPATMDMMLVTFMAHGRGSTTTTKPTSYTLAQNPDSGGTTTAACEAGGAYLSVTNGSASSTSWSTSNSSASTTIHLAVIDPGTTQPRLVRQSNLNTGVTASTIDVPMPFCGVGDVLVALIDSTTSGTITAPSGWTLQQTDTVTSGGNPDTGWLYTRIADGTEGTTQQWSFSSSANNNGSTYAVTAPGVVTSAKTVDTTSDTAYSVPGLTMAAQSPNVVLLSFVVIDRGDRVTTAAPSGYTTIFASVRSSATSTVPCHASAFKYETGSDPASGSFTGDTASINVGFTISLGATASTISDSVTTSDEVAGLVSRPRTLADTVSTSDSANSDTGAVVAVTASDSIAASDSATETASHPRTASDTASTSDAVAGGKLAARTASDSPATSDSAARIVAAPRTASDGAATSDSSTRVLSAARTASDSLTLVDEAVSAGRTLTDAVTTSDAASRVAVLGRTASDSVTTSEAVEATNGNDADFTAADAVTTSDAVAAMRIVNVSATDSVTTSDTTTRLRNLGRTLTDTLTASATVARTLVLGRTASDGTYLSDAALFYLITEVPGYEGFVSSYIPIQPANVHVYVAGVEITDDVMFSSARFVSKVNGKPGEAYLRVRDSDSTHSFTQGSDWLLTINGQAAWRGYVTEVIRTYIAPAEDLVVSGLQRVIDLRGVDLNILFTKRIAYKKSDPSDVEGTKFPAGTSDTTAIRELLNNWLDLSSDGLDVTSGVRHVGDLDPSQATRAWSGSWTWGQAMDSIATLPAAIYYIRPEIGTIRGTLVYCDADTATSPLTLTDQPYPQAIPIVPESPTTPPAPLSLWASPGDGSVWLSWHAVLEADYSPPAIGSIGYREMEIILDGTGLANDVLEWGMGYGSQDPVFSRLTDTASVTTHGRWQEADRHSGVYKQGTIDRIADSIVYGSPDNHRGAKDDRPAVSLTTYMPGLLAGQVVPFESNVWSWSDILPVRQMEVTFEAPQYPKYTALLSHEIDAPWGFIDQFWPKVPGYVGPCPKPPCFKPPPPVKPPPPTPGWGNAKWRVVSHQYCSGYNDSDPLYVYDDYFHFDNEDGSGYFDHFNRVVPADSWGTTDDATHTWVKPNLNRDNDSLLYVTEHSGITDVEPPGPTYGWTTDAFVGADSNPPGGPWGVGIYFNVGWRWKAYWNTESADHRLYSHAFALIDTVTNYVLYWHRWDWDENGHGHEGGGEGGDPKDPGGGGCGELKYYDELFFVAPGEWQEGEELVWHNGRLKCLVNQHGTFCRHCEDAPDCDGGGGGCGITDSFTRTVSGGWGTSDAGPVWTVNGEGVYGVDGTRGSIVLTGASNSDQTHVTLPASIASDFSVVLDFSLSGDGFSNIGSTDQFVVRVGAGSNYSAWIYEGTASTPTIRLYNSGGYGTSSTSLALTFGTTYRSRFQRSSGWLQFRVWDAATTEPESWTQELDISSAAVRLNSFVAVYLNSFNNRDLTAYFDSLDISGINNCGIFDTFTRTVADGAGTSDSGMVYDANYPGTVSVDGSRAVLDVTSNTSISFSGLTLVDPDVLVTIQSTANGVAYVEVYGNNPVEDDRMFDVTFTQTGLLTLIEYETSTSTSTTLGWGATTPTKLHLTAVGTALSVSAWRTTDTEPSSPTLTLTAPAGYATQVYDQFYVGGNSGAFTLYVDDLYIGSRGDGNATGSCFGYDDVILPCTSVVPGDPSEYPGFVAVGPNFYGCVTGQPDVCTDTTTVFTVALPFIPGSTHVFLDGVKIVRGVDYTENSDNLGITLTESVNKYAVVYVCFFAG